MLDFRFVYMNKDDIDAILPSLFKILYFNMQKVAPSDACYEEGYIIWSDYIRSEIQDDLTETILIYHNDDLVGYFRYSIDTKSRSLLMADVQFVPEYQGKGLFNLLFKYVVGRLPKDILTVEAYANKTNHKSFAILEHLGLRCVGENKNGISFHYIGDFSLIYNKYI